jgi:hypothetical protein
MQGKRLALTICVVIIAASFSGCLVGEGNGDGNPAQDGEEAVATPGGCGDRQLVHIGNADDPPSEAVQADENEDKVVCVNDRGQFTDNNPES